MFLILMIFEKNLKFFKNNCCCYGFFKKVNIFVIFFMNYDVYVSWFFFFILGKIIFICIGLLINVVVVLWFNLDFGK